MFGVARAAARSNGRIKSLESSIGTLGTDLAGLDMRFCALHEEASDTASRVGWVSDDARVASRAALGIEVGLMELERQGHAREAYFSSQVARVDRLIIAMRAVLLDVGIIFTHSHRSFQTLSNMVGHCEARLQETIVLQLIFCHWAGVLRASRVSELGRGELLRQCLCAWNVAA